MLITYGLCELIIRLILMLLNSLLKPSGWAAKAKTDLNLTY